MLIDPKEEYFDLLVLSSEIHGLLSESDYGEEGGEDERGYVVESEVKIVTFLQSGKWH